MKTAFLFPLLLVAHLCAGQGYDANWVFGVRAGIDFSDTSNPQVYKTRGVCHEAAASISYQNGFKLFYVTSQPPGSSDIYYQILDAKHLPIENGDSLKISNTATNGALIIPAPGFENRFYLFQIAFGSHYPNISTFPSVDHDLLYSVIAINDSGKLAVITKNQLLMPDVEERLAAVKCPNGKDWWVFAHARFTGNNFIGRNRFHRFFLYDGGIVTSFQDIGPLYGENNSHMGEMKFSLQGDKLASAIYGADVIELYDFNRCTGLLSNLRNINRVSTNESSTRPYGCEFSPSGNLLYVSWHSVNYTCELYQYSIEDTSVAEVEIWSNSNVSAGQIERAPNNKIYIVSNYPYGIESENLGVVNFPDLSGLACNFQPFSFSLADSAVGGFGLPNFPNYNLAPVGIYQADAGDGTLVICLNQSNNVTLGTQEVEHVLYSWSPAESLNDTTLAQPIASPSTSTWYYLVVTDTTNSSCVSTRTDSVLVEVRDCSVGIEETASHKPLAVSIYPNPTEGILHVELMHNNIALHRIEISDLSGKRVMQQETAFIAQHTTLNTQHMANGVYFVKVELSNGQSVVQKVVVR